MNNKNSFGYIVGKWLGAIIVTCIAVCIAAIIIALTLKFVCWIF